LDDPHTSKATTTGSFTSTLTDLSENTNYYVRAYAISGNETLYGLQKTFRTKPALPTGAINGLFSVSYNNQVWFSKGNLQYNASLNSWRFAEKQWDYIGNDNSNISSSYDGWIDFYGWGTSGYNHGATCYQPWSVSQDNDSYLVYGMEGYNLVDETKQADWGYNPIVNGGQGARLGQEA